MNLANTGTAQHHINRLKMEHLRDLSDSELDQWSQNITANIAARKQELRDEIVGLDQLASSLFADYVGERRRRHELAIAVEKEPQP